MSKTTTAVGLAMVGAMISALAGCGTGEADGTVITLSANLIEQPGMDAIIADFEAANPDVTVKPAYAAQSDRGSVLSTQIQAGSGPDIVGLVGGSGAPPSVFQFAAGDKLADLSSTPWAADLPEFTKPAVTFEGTVAALPALTYVVASIYNASLFERQGLEVPETFDELLAACSSIRGENPDMIPIAWPGTSPVYMIDFILMGAMSEVYAQNPDWDDQRARGEVKFQTTPGWKAAVERVIRLKDAECFGPSTPSDTFQQSVSQVASEQAAMMIGGDILLPVVRAANEKDQFGVFPVPGTTPEETYVLLDPAGNFAINAASDNADAARKFIDFLATSDQSDRFSKSIGTVSRQDYARSSDPGVAAEALGEDHSLLAPYASRFVLNPTYTWPSSTIVTALSDAGQGLFTGQSTPDDVLQAADDAWDQATN
ncbi:extracellular solute-binding protein [Rhodococcus fascians]|nr:extracellular solute-binding protein [Rhodococcus fascians]